MKWIINKQFKGQTVKLFLKQGQLFSRRILKSLVHEGGSITLNGVFARLNDVLSIGDQLQVEFPKEEKGFRMVSQEMFLDIVFEDDFLIVVNKPAQMATIPSFHHPTGTLANGVLYYYEKKGIPYTVHIVTRLDRGTSGLVLIAKNRYSHSLLSNLQLTYEIKRKYYAIVPGIIEPTRGTIAKSIGRKEGSLIERTVVDNGKSAITDYKTIKISDKHSLLDIQLKTGRTHQVRVHLSHSGHPLAGDDLYDGSQDLIGRQALHCHEINFRHPFTQQWMTCQSPLPDDMMKLLGKC